MRKPNALRVLTAIATLVLAACLAVAPAHAGASRARNVIVMIADGCGSEQYTLTRWFLGRPLSFDPHLAGMLRTWCADSVVTDSAPAASAFATGQRTSDKLVSVGPGPKTLPGFPTPPAGLQYAPLATVLEGARLAGKATGIVATSRVTHATPAAFMAHVPSRAMENEIMEQAVYNNVDVVLGGGKSHLLPRESGGRREDGENLIPVLAAKRYHLVEDRDGLMQVKSGKVYGLFAPSHMEAEIDRPSARPGQPTLEEMTRQAIALLAQDRDGFFLMVEGSQIDWADHANDPAHLLSDMIQYERAAQAALDFARKDGKTLVLLLSDHNTGGLSIGNSRTNHSYPQMGTEELLAPLRRLKASSSALWRKVEKTPTPAAVQAAVAEGWGMDCTEPQARAILDLAALYKEAPNYAFGEVLCPAFTNLGWTTHGHVGGDVPFYAYGPGRPAGLIDGPEVGAIIARALGLDLKALNTRLYVPAEKAFPGASLATAGDDRNPALRVELKGRTALLPADKNLMVVDGATRELEGLVILAKTGTWYVPAQAGRILDGK